MRSGTGPSLATERARREGYRENIPYVFDATAELYYTYWGDYFHFAIFEPGEDERAYEAALERTHQRYFDLIGAARAGRVLELACGGGAFTEWIAERTGAEVVGLDLAPCQLARARKRLEDRPRRNLRFVEHDIMRAADLPEAPFDAAVCLDAACYLPDKAGALEGIATVLRPGARLLLVDWCRAEQASALQEELILEPFYQRWGIPRMESMSGYRRAFGDAGFRLLQVDDLSQRVTPNWHRSYGTALRALAAVPAPAELVRLAAAAMRHGREGVRLLKGQFHSVLLAKAAADAGLLRYALFLAERTPRAASRP